MRFASRFARTRRFLVGGGRRGGGWREYSLSINLHIKIQQYRLLLDKQLNPAYGLGRPALLMWALPAYAFLQVL